jgi:hypothetical protein
LEYNNDNAKNIKGLLNDFKVKTKIFLLKTSFFIVKRCSDNNREL